MGVGFRLQNPDFELEVFSVQTRRFQSRSFVFEIMNSDSMGTVGGAIFEDNFVDLCCQTPDFDLEPPSNFKTREF